MSRARWIAAVVEAGLAGVLAGVVDLALIARHSSLPAGDLPEAALVVVGLAIGLVGLLGLPIVLGSRLLARHPALAAVLSGVREPGAARVEALVRLTLALVAAAIVWAIGFTVIGRVGTAFRHGGAAAMLSATVIVVVAVAAWLATTAAAGPIARRAGRRAVLVRLTRGRIAAALLAVLLLAAVTALPRGLAAVAPAWDPTWAYVVLVALLGLIGCAGVGVGARLGRWGAGFAAVVGTIVVAAALVRIGTADRTRGAVAGHGVISRVALSTLWWLTDGDGDHVSDRFGGRDCDDGDPAVHPGAPEVRGNGVDDNCRLGDAPDDPTDRRRAPQPSTAPGSRRLDIILVTFDAMRADHVSAYGYPRPTTATIDALAARGTRFAAAQSPSPSTRAALPALLFGRHVGNLAFERIDGLPALARNDLPTLASTLRAAGYTTATTASNDGLLSPNTLTGFDVELGIRSGGPEGTRKLTDIVFNWIREQPFDRPYFMWIHYMAPHDPYAPADLRFGDDDAARYDAEIAATDEQLGRLMADLVTRDRMRQTVVVVAADHGESFGERGERFHNRSLYEEQTHIPLVIAMPDGPAHVVDAPVSLIDVGPTLLDLVGVTTPAGMDGRSQAPAVRDGLVVPPQPVLGELIWDQWMFHHLVSIHHGRYLLIHNVLAATDELYDLAADPAQQHDLSDQPIGAELRRVLDDTLERELVAAPR